MDVARGAAGTWVRRHKQALLDLALALSILAFAEALPAYQFSAYPNPQVGHTYGALIAILALPQVLPLALRRRAPVGTFVVILLASFVPIFVWGWQVQPGYAMAIANAVGIYTVAAHRVRPISLAVLTAYLFAVLYLLAYGPYAQWFGDILPSFVMFIGVPAAAAWIAGDYVQKQRVKAKEFAAQAALEELAREEAARAAIGEERAQQAVAAERDRIARELHDVVAHSMSVMVVQASAARRIVRTDPVEATKSMASIEDTGREALTEMRRLLGAVRKRDAAAPDRAPQPGVEQLQPLIDKVRAAGVDVTMEVRGSQGALPPGVSLSCYRVVQEALTNILKHSQAKHAKVELTFGRDHVQVAVTDDGRGWTSFQFEAHPPGFGLIGLRERVAVFGGEFDSGNLPDSGGFYVSAKLPVPTG